MQVLRGEYESMKRYLRFRNSSLRVLRAGFNGNDVIVNAIRRGNRNIRFARLFFPFSLPLSLSRRPRETLLSRSMSLSRSSERAEMRKKRAWMDAWCDARGAKQRVYVSPVTDRVNVEKDEEGLRFRGWTEGDGALPSPFRLPPGWKGRRGGIGERDGWKKKRRKISAPSACPSMRDGVRGSYIYAIHYVFG